MEQFFQEFCDKVIALYSSIRFIGIADGHGRLLATSERKGLKPLLNEEETAQYAITAATRHRNYDFEHEFSKFCPGIFR
jgi:hypothetical protein